MDSSGMSRGDVKEETFEIEFTFHHFDHSERTHRKDEDRFISESTETSLFMNTSVMINYKYLSSLEGFVSNTSLEQLLIQTIP